MEVDYPRVTHPFAGLLTLAGFLPRLACVRHAASVRSEPGSNSPIIFIRAFVSWLADVTTTSLKALRCPQSSSWTCYPVFKDRALLQPTAGQTFYNSLQATQLPAPHCRAVRAVSLLRGGLCNRAAKRCQRSRDAEIGSERPPARLATLRPHDRFQILVGAVEVVVHHPVLVSRRASEPDLDPGGMQPPADGRLVVG